MLKQFTCILKFFYILFQSKKRPAKTKCVPAKLCAELVIAKSDSTQCQSARSLTLCSVSQFGIVNKVSANKHMSLSQRYLVAKKLFDSAQCLSARRPTPCSISQRGVTYFTNISAKTNLLAKPCQPVYQGPMWVLFIK